MTATAKPARYSAREELANSLSHGIGAALATAALVVLVTLAAIRGDAWSVVGCAIFGTSLVLLYTASTLYHAVRKPRAKSILRAFDHSAIFLLIAGTYTPFTLVNLRGPWGWTLFGIIWGLAAMGIILQMGVIRRGAVLSVLLYLTMGWTVMIAIKPLLRVLPPGGFALLLAGGLAYTLGIVFYSWRRLPFHHAVWHVFVLLGSAFHFFAILRYVIPGTA